MKRPRSPILIPVVLVAALALGGGFVGNLLIGTTSASPGFSGTLQEPGHAQDETENGPFVTSSGFENTLRLTGPLQLPTLDPAFVKDLGSMFLVRQVYGGLMRFDDDLHPIPAIAESVEISDDGLIYRFVISEQARFFSGDAITADDAVFSLTRALDPATAGGDTSALAAPTFLADILGAEALLAGESDELPGVRALDERTLEIELAQPRSTFLMRLAAAPASIIDEGDLSLGDRWWKSPNASGPFAIMAFVDDYRLTLRPNQHYVLGAPKLDSVQIRIGPEAFGALNLYESALIDITGVDYLNIERIIDAAGQYQADLRVTPQFAVEYIAFRTDIEPLNDPAIRQALLLGYPRHRVAEVTFNGRAAAGQGLVPDGMLGVDQWPVEEEYDLERARELVAGSTYGSADRVPPIAIYTSVPNRAESFRDALQRGLGLQIDVIVVDWLSYLTGLANKEYPAYLLYWGADYPDPESMLLTLFGEGRADNYIDYANPEFDDLLKAASLEQDPAARAELYAAANQELMSDAVVVPLYYDVAYTLVRPWVQDLVMTPLGILYLDEAWIGE